MDEHLLGVLQLAQDAGVIGNTDLSEEIARARVFVAALGACPSNAAVLDIGSGGGLPGLVIAHDRPDVHVTLIDRRKNEPTFYNVKSLAFADINLDSLLM